MLIDFPTYVNIKCKSVELRHYIERIQAIRIYQINRKTISSNVSFGKIFLLWMIGTKNIVDEIVTIISIK